MIRVTIKAAANYRIQWLTASMLMEPTKCQLSRRYLHLRLLILCKVETPQHVIRVLVLSSFQQYSAVFLVFSIKQYFSIKY